MSEQLYPPDKRKTEWACVFLMVKGYIPFLVYTAPFMSDYFAPPWAHKLAAHPDDGWGLEDTLKFCGVCGEWYPATPYFFHRNPDGKHGLYSQCRWCVAEKKRSKRAETLGRKPRGYRRKLNVS